MLNIILLLFIYVKTDPTKLTEYDQFLNKSTFLKSFFLDVGWDGSEILILYI
jgi:hypothetical protein